MFPCKLCELIFFFSDIEARQDAVEEILKGSYEEMDKVKDMMTKLPDVERGLCSIYHKKVNNRYWNSLNYSVCVFWKICGKYMIIPWFSSWYGNCFDAVSTIHSIILTVKHMKHLCISISVVLQNCLQSESESESISLIFQ